MLALGGSAPSAAGFHWPRGSFVSVQLEGRLPRTCSFSLDARGVNVLVGNTYEGFPEPRIVGEFSLRDIFYAHFIRRYLNCVLEFAL